MFAAGVNFALWYRALLRDPSAFRRDEEFRLYAFLVVAASALVAVLLLVGDVYQGAHAAIRHGAFQVLTIVTTTGYASADFALWTPATIYVLLILMFLGGCAGSTSGGIKVIRWLVAARAMGREVRTTVHPEAVQTIRVSGRGIDERSIRSTLAFVLGYLLVAGLGTTVLMVDAGFRGFELVILDAAAAAATTLGNIGPGLGAAGPMGSFEGFSDVATVAMSTLMWIGRLELLPVLALVTRSYWLR